MKGGDGIYVVSVPNGALSADVLQALKSNSAVVNAEPNQKVILIKNPKLVQQQVKTRNCATTATIPGKFRYTSQAAVGIVCLADAQKQFGGGSAGVHVAVIDTAIDATHPVLSPGRMLVSTRSE